MKPRKRIAPVSAKRLKSHPELAYSSSTIVRQSSSPKKQAKRSKPKQRNAKRAKANHERAYGEKRVWIVRQPCAVCGDTRTSEPAHTSGDGGAGYKSSAKYLLPLCSPRLVHTIVEATEYPRKGSVFRREHITESWDEGCHAETHRVGVKTFERTHNVSLVALAAEYHERWLAQGGAA